MRHIIMDTETTGLIANTGRSLVRQPRVIELCAHVFNDKGKSIAKFDELFSLPPGEKLSAKITEITHLTDEDLAGKPQFFERVEAVRDFFIKAKANVVVAHNLSFDMEMIDNEFKRSDTVMPWPKRKICTVEQTRHLKGFNLSLDNLYLALFETGRETAHRAEVDVMDLAKCYFELRKRKEL
jgi:DNA polymerase III alpha subunit (gram-positive type)